MLYLGLHVDTNNGKPFRFATAIMYLNDTGPGGLRVLTTAIKMGFYAAVELLVKSAEAAAEGDDAAEAQEVAEAQ
mgnify:CR=1 FL=1